MKVTIGNSMSKIEGYSQAQFNELRSLLSYTSDPKAQFYAGFKGANRKYLISKRGEFPTGLIYLVEDWASGKGVTFADTRVRPRPLKKPLVATLKHRPYDEQARAAAVCRGTPRGIVTAPTGAGKSVIVALMIEALQVKTLVVVPSLELKRQLTEFLTQTFGKAAMKDTISVENIASLDPSLTSHGYAAVIIDEFHHSGAVSYRKLNQKAWNGVFYRFGTTATPFRSQDHERLLLESVLSKVIYQIDYATAVNKKFIVPMEAFYYSLPKRPVEGYSWQEVYKELVVENEARNQLIANTLLTLQEGGKSTLCLVKEIRHGEILSELTGIPFANGQDETCEGLIADFNSKATGSLIATSGVCGEGVDTKPAEYIVIAGLGKSKPAFMQQCGRVFRTYPGKESGKVIIFRDPSHKWTIAHFREQCKILKCEYGVTPMELA